jgi:glycine/D-amino acid oxidase-like deaminating enzyme
MSKLYTGPFALSYDLKPLRPGDVVRDLADRLHDHGPVVPLTVVTVEEITVSHPDLGGRVVTVLTPDGTEAMAAHFLRKIEADGGRA